MPEMYLHVSKKIKINFLKSYKPGSTSAKNEVSNLFK